MIIYNNSVKARCNHYIQKLTKNETGINWFHLMLMKIPWQLHNIQNRRNSSGQKSEEECSFFSPPRKEALPNTKG